MIMMMIVVIFEDMKNKYAYLKNKYTCLLSILGTRGNSYKRHGKRRIVHDGQDFREKGKLVKYTSKSA